MKFSETLLHKCYVIEPHIVEDNRGWFMRAFCKEDFQEIGHTKEWLQLNHSVSFHKGSLRGMHYQVPPFAEIKMVRCIAGSVFDVVVDIRQDSPTFLNYIGVELSAENRNMIYIPEGFAHGFQTLTDNCQLLYHHTEVYTPGCEGGLQFDDKLLDIRWPLPVTEISTRDRTHPYLDHNFKGIAI